jgi:RNA polymerase sigma-70 factor (ECF subfamily)
MYAALAQVPDEQREVIALRLKAGMRFKQIAEIQNTSYVAAQARYRRGIDKLRSLLNGELEA